MNVRELIEKLKEMPPYMEVRYSDGFVSSNSIAGIQIEEKEEVVSYQPDRIIQVDGRDVVAGWKPDKTETVRFVLIM